MTDPHSRQPAYDAVFAYIRQHPAHAATDYGQAAENARLWRAVEAALDAMEAMTDLIPAPRPVPSPEDRMRDARTDHTFATYLDRTDRAQLDARAACAEQERDEALDELRDSRADRKHKSDLLIATARALDMLPGDLVDDTPAVAGRLRAERDEALDARNVLRQQLDTARAELGAAQELLAVVDDLAEQLDRARARYATRPNQWRHHPCGLTTTLPDGDKPTGGWCNRCQNDLGTDSWVAVTPGLGSAPPRAQEQPADAAAGLPTGTDETLAWMRRHGLGHGAGVGAVLAAVRADRAQREG